MHIIHINKKIILKAKLFQIQLLLKKPKQNNNNKNATKHTKQENSPLLQL